MKSSLFAPSVVGLVAAMTLAAAPLAHSAEPEPGAALSVTEAAVLTLPAADGVRDASQVTVASDIATTVIPRIYSAKGDLVAELPSIVLDAEKRSARLTVNVSSIKRPGLHRLEMTPTSGDAVSVDLRVGSGAPADVSLALSPRSIWSWSKAEANTSTATVAAVDETGLSIPFTGTVVAVQGKRSMTSKVTSTTGQPARATVSGTKLGAGTAKVTFTAKAGGASRSTSTTLKVTDTTVTSTKIAASQKTIYPTKDGYLDTTKLTVASQTSTGKAVSGEGAVTITSAGKTVASWKLRSSQTWSATWDGKVKGKIVPGTYSVKVTIRGPQGGAKSASTSVTVKAGKLVEKTVKKTHKASSILATYVPLDEYEEGYCEHDEVTFACIGFDAYYGDDAVSLIADGTTAVPSAVRDAYKFGGVKVKMTLGAPVVSGQAVWGYGTVEDPTAKLTEMTEGTSSPGWYTVPGKPTKLGVTAATGLYSYFITDTITVEYRYKVMGK